MTKRTHLCLSAVGRPRPTACQCIVKCQTGAPDTTVNSQHILRRVGEQDPTEQQMSTAIEQGADGTRLRGPPTIYMFQIETGRLLLAHNSPKLGQNTTPAELKQLTGITDNR